MDPNNGPLPSVEYRGDDELQSPHSPAQSNRGATYSPSGDHHGAPRQNEAAGIYAGGQSGYQSHQSPGYSPVASYSAAQHQYSPGISDAHGRNEQQSPQFRSGNAYSPIASYSTAPGQNGAQYTNQYSHQSPATQFSPPNQYSPAHSPNVASPAPSYLSNFMNLSPTGHQPGAYSPNASNYSPSSPQANLPTRRNHRSPRGGTQSPYPERNDYAAVRAPQGAPRSPLGPLGVFSAVPASGFQGYEQGVNLEIPRPPQASPRRSRQVKSSASPAVAELGPGSDPPPPPQLFQSKNNKEKYVDANVPDRFEQFILSEGEKKCVGKPDTREYLHLCHAYCTS